MLVYTYRKTQPEDEIVMIDIDEQKIDRFGKLYAARERDKVGVPLLDYYDGMWGVGWCYKRADELEEQQAIDHINERGLQYYEFLYTIMNDARAYAEQLIQANKNAHTLRDIAYVVPNHRLFRRCWPELADAVLRSAYEAEDRIDPDNAEKRRRERLEYRWAIIALKTNREFDYDARDLEENIGVWSVHTPEYKSIVRRAGNVINWFLTAQT